VTQTLPDAPNMEHLKTLAKRLQVTHRANDLDAINRVKANYPQGSRSEPSGTAIPLKLSIAQLVIAREYGFASWQKLKHHVESVRDTAQSATAACKFRQIVAELHLADVAAAATFFEGNLGFKRGYSLAYPDGRLDFAVMVNDPVEILLHNITADIHADVPKHVRFFFRAIDIRGLHNELTSRGNAITELIETDYSTLEFSMMGPEGYRLVFQQFV
jgi:hypothetical protein